MDFNNIGPLPTSSPKSTSAKAGLIEDFSDKSRVIRSGGSLSASLHLSICCVTTVPTCGRYFVSSDGTRKVHLPAQLIKEYFGQPEAEVVDGDEFLVLLDEFLGLISA